MGEVESRFQCRVCRKPIVQEDPSWMHADGKTYRHRIDPVPVLESSEQEDAVTKRADELCDYFLEGEERVIWALDKVLRNKTSPELIAAIVADLREELRRGN